MAILSARNIVACRCRPFTFPQRGRRHNRRGSANQWKGREKQHPRHLRETFFYLPGYAMVFPAISPPKLGPSTRGIFAATKSRVGDHPGRQPKSKFPSQLACTFLQRVRTSRTLLLRGKQRQLHEVKPTAGTVAHSGGPMGRWHNG